MYKRKKLLSWVFAIFFLILTACNAQTDLASTTQTETAVTTSNETGTTTVANVAVSTAVSTSTQTVAEAAAENSAPHENGDDYLWDNASAINIVLADDGISVEGEGVDVNGRIATITNAGTYNLSGSLTEGQIVVDTADEDVVQLIFDGIEISNSATAPIYVASAEETVIILAEGSQNFVTDGANYVFANAAEDEPNAAVFSKDDFSISGEGSLTVEANYNDGIASKDGLIIDSGNIIVNAVDDGIRGKDYLIIKDGNITVTAQGDGLKSDEDEDTTLGYISVEGGTLTVTSGDDAIQAATDVLIAGGDFSLTSGGGSNGSVAADASAKGIKGAVSVNIDGGSFTINSADDAIHSNNSIVINNGSFVIASGDDGLHADATLEINGGTIDIQKSYEGIEATDVIVNGGTIDIISSDDGINGADGNDSSSIDVNNGGRLDNFTGSQSSITINGGTITIAAAGSGNGDGLDANGTITISGGDIVIKVPASYRDYSNIDFDTAISFTGGSVRTLDVNGTYTEVTSDSIGMIGGFDGPGGGGRPGGGGQP